jgi:hypothetical protein
VSPALKALDGLRQHSDCSRQVRGGVVAASRSADLSDSIRTDRDEPVSSPLKRVPLRDIGTRSSGLDADHDERPARLQSHLFDVEFGDRIDVRFDPPAGVIGDNAGVCESAALRERSSAPTTSVPPVVLAKAATSAAN